MSKPRSKNKSPQSQLSKTDIDEINHHFSFQQSVEYLRTFADHPEMLISLSESARLKKAAKDYLPFLYKHFSLLNCPEYIRELFLKSMVVPSSFMTPLTKTDNPYILAAQAIWLLDTFMKTPRESVFLELLPKDAPELEEILDFYFYDTVHPESYVNSVVFLLAERKGKTKDAFSAVLSMIEKTTIKHLTTLFENHILDFFKRALTLYRRSRQPLDERLRMLTETITDVDSISSELLTTKSLAQNGFLAENFMVCAPEVMSYTLESMTERLGDKHAAEMMITFGDGDPYDLCAAYLFLSEQDHTLAHLNALTGAVLSYAVSRLPWKTESHLLDEPMLDKTNRPDYSMMDVHNMWIDSSGAHHIDCTLRMNYGQLLHSCCDIILPRRSGISTELVDSLKEQGVTENIAREIAALSQISYYTMYQDMRYSDLSPKLSTEETEPDNANTSENISLEDQLTEAKEQISVLSKQIENIKKSLDAAERTHKKLQQQLQSTQTSAQEDHEELIHLRETIFQIQSQEDEKSVPDTSITFPYETQRRICIFGGHDTWRKTIKPFLPNASFYDRDTLPHPDTIRNADIVWIQPNAMSHSYYYSILNVAREYRIPVRYFGYASARKCAEEVVLAEQYAPEK